MRTSILCSSLAAFFAAAGTFQGPPDPRNPENADLEVPANWKVRVDRPMSEEVRIGSNKEEADIFFVNMVPGWHITTGPAAIFYHPASTAGGSYRAETIIHLFDPQGRNEGWGLFLGGQNLDRDAPAYTSFLLRNSGEYRVEKQRGDRTAVVQDWTDAPSMNPYGDSADPSVKNVLAVEVGESKVAFFVNEQEVTAVPRGEVGTEGIVGLRILEGVNVHVEDLKVSELRK